MKEISYRKCITCKKTTKHMIIFLNKNGSYKYEKPICVLNECIERARIQERELWNLLNLKGTKYE